jgi:hypothetical protein
MSPTRYRKVIALKSWYTVNIAWAGEPADD